MKNIRLELIFILLLRWRPKKSLEFHNYITAKVLAKLLSPVSHSAASSLPSLPNL